jgi:shikimate kinase
MSVFLIGYRGSGKSSVGEHVARKLGWDFADSDSIITNAAEMSIKEIFEIHGEAHFRDLETATVKTLCEWQEAVISLGGGAVIRDVNRQLIAKSGFSVIYLHADAETLHERITRDPRTQATRPNLTHLGGSVEEVRELLNQRLPLYRELHTDEIDVTNLSVKQVADRVLELIEVK